MPDQKSGGTDQKLTLSSPGVEELLKAWGKNVTEYRQHRKLTQRDLAAKTSKSQSAINHLEGGKFSPSDEFRIELAKALDVTVETLFPYPKPKGKK